MGKSWLAASESALNNAQNMISDVKDLCVQMATATTDATQRASAAETVQNTLEEIISLAQHRVERTVYFRRFEDR